ncbi:MAG: response regulator transcription factor [Saprospiraceae bacterium]
MNVLLIEDEPKTSSFLKAFLEENNIYCKICQDVDDALNVLLKDHFDIIVTDIIMPGKSGLELVKTIRERKIKSPVLVISALGETEHKVQGLNVGADDYLPKPFDLNEFLARISALYRRSKMSNLSTEKLQFKDLELNLSSMEVIREGNSIVLSPKEFNLLAYLVRNQGRVVPKSELLEQVWNLGNGINTNVVEVYINYVRKKVDKNYPIKYLHTLHGIGYVIKTEKMLE